MRLLTSRAPWPLRWHLAALIACVLIPVMAFSSYVMLQLADRVRDIAERRLLRTARAMSASIDGEFWATTRALETLAESNALANGDLEGFASEARRVLRSRPTWMTVILASPEGEQLVNLAAQPKEALGKVVDPASLQEVVQTRSAQVGRLLKGQRHAHWGFPIRIPILRDGQVRYVLSAVLAPAGLQGVLGVPDDPDLSELTRTVVDPNYIVAFRSRNPEAFIGVKATEQYQKETAKRTEGLFPSTTLDGIPSYVAFTRSQAGWYASVIVPREVLDGPRRRSSIALIVSAILAVLFSIGGASIFLRRVARGMGSVASASEALVRGEIPHVAPLSIAELDRLGRSLTQSAKLLRERAEERDRHLAQAQAAVRSRDEFLSLASHELRTPLTSLQLHAKMVERELGRRGEVERSRVERLVEQTHKQVGRLARLVDDMLDISRIAAGKLSIQLEPMDLSAVAQEVAGRMSPHLREAGCELTVDAPEPVEGNWDRYRLEQVLTNLLSNAARYGGCTPVEVSVRRLGEAAEVRVVDHGPGIAVEDRERVFQKFERAEGIRKASGLGLGLFIVREIAQMHGGSVRVEGHPGQGAIFVVTLPIVAKAMDVSAA
jgi:signal transduction histidine kinase